MLPTERAKTLTQDALSGSMAKQSGMLRDVNKPLAIAEQNCVSPINAQDSSNLKIQKFISLEKTGFADMYFVPRRKALSQRGGNAKVP